MFLLNLKFFQKNSMRSQAIWFSFIFYVIYILNLYLFLYKLHIGYKSISYSLIISSLILYYFSNDTITEDFKRNHKNTKNFLFIPHNSTFFDDYFYRHYNEILKISLKLYIDRFPYAMIYLFSFFIGKYYMSCNIILMNLFLILHAISKGLSATIKNYIQYNSIVKKNSHLAKIRYIKIFTIVNICTSLFFCFLIFIFNQNICYIYISHPHEIIKRFLSLYLYCYIFTIFIDFIKQELEGYIKGIDISNNILIYKIFSIFVFLPLGFALCFLLKFGLKGFWLGILISIFVQCIPHSINVYKNYEIFLI
jgi:Na+-driven multidrug efflux pump